MSAIQKDSMDIIIVPCLMDNYAYILIDKSKDKVAVVDPSEAEPIINALQQRGLKLDYIMNTHHHFDHCGGNIALKRKYSCQVIGPKADKDRIPGIDIQLGDSQKFQIGASEFITYDTPGHTLGHVSYYFPQTKSVFTGDHLFALGCGRAFEGTYQQMWDSLEKIRKLPSETEVYCGHEYTQQNAKFAASINPSNKNLKEYTVYVNDQRSKKLGTIPSTLEKELASNPFLRPEDKEIRASLKLQDGATNAQVFAAVRKAKDWF